MKRRLFLMSRYLLNLLRDFRWGYILLVILMGVCIGGVAEINEETALLHLVINEIEINPFGFDTGNEWVELYNPTDAAIDLEGWQISYTYRSPGTEVIATESILIQPGGYFVFTYSGLRLTNATPGIVKNPALPGRGFSKQMQLLWSLCPLFVKPNVFLDHFRRHFVPHRPRKVSILPELPSP
jgi:hypothetical protein